MLRVAPAEEKKAIGFLTVLVAVLLSTSRADAAGADVNLVWRAPAGCPDRPHVLERVRQILGDATPDASGVDAVATVEKKSLYELVITTRRGDAEHTRTVASASCSALGDAAAIIVAVALDEAREAASSKDGTVVSEGGAERETRELSPKPEAVAASPTRPASEDRPALPAPATQAKPSRASFGIGAATAFDVGTLPHPTFGAGLVAALTVGRLEVGLAGTLWAEGEQKHTTQSRAGVRFDVVDAGAFGCWAPVVGRYRIGGCAEVDATVMTIEGFGIRQPGAARILFPTLRAGAMAELALTRRLIVFGRADLAVAVAVPRVVLTTLGDNVGIHEVSIPAVRLTLGLRADVL